MNTTDQLRRGLVVGGLVATAALTLPAVARRIAGKAKGRIDPDAVVSTFGEQSEIDRWEALVGQSFRLGTADGFIGATLAAVERGSFDPARPVELGRALSFYLFFTVGASVAPDGQESYTILHPGIDVNQVFLARGEDRGNEAVVYGLFN